MTVLPSCLCVPMQPQSISSCYRLYLLDCTAETSDSLRYQPSVSDLLIVFADCFWLHWSETIFRSQLRTKHFSMSASALENTQPVSLLLLCVCVCVLLLAFVLRFFHLSPRNRSDVSVQKAARCLRFEPSDCGKLGEFQWVLVLPAAWKLMEELGRLKSTGTGATGFCFSTYPVSDMSEAGQLIADVTEVSSLCVKGKLCLFN